LKKEHLQYLACPKCKSDLEIFQVTKENNNRIEQGILKCQNCNEKFKILHYIPRFVPIENYASSFGHEWITHSKTQYDSFNGSKTSEKRFFESSRWPRDLQGEVVLEAGSGSGRFTEVVAATGAMVVSLDYSYAVEANYASNGDKDNILIIQADIFQMPLRDGFFDKIFCFGVLQHTPNVEKAFLSLPPLLKSGGNIVIDVYRKYGGIVGALYTKHWIRPITRRMSPTLLYDLCKRYVEFMWPVAKFVNRVPNYGRLINRALLIADYIGFVNLPVEKLKEWAILDTFDMLSPRYDFPQYIQTVKKWFQKAKLSKIRVRYGYNGIEGSGGKN
jgi:SAM-dependent methyltransferase